MKILALLLSCSFFSCGTSDRSDKLPDFNKDHIANINTITITNNQMSPRRSKQLHPGPKHPKVEVAHEELRRLKEEDDFITCCCFLKIKKPFKS